jgi:acyl-CoA synthetase (NDP forming)
MPVETEVRMSVRNLDKLLKPQSIALIGATPRPGGI